jgi:adenosylmethionine-8-amino-7-oxononanoate aminotransferase
MNRSRLIKPELDGVYPIATYGYGVYIFDENNKKYLDASSGAVTANIGHGVQEVVDAMIEQANKISFVYRSQFSSRPAEELAEKLAHLTPGDVNWSFFVNSGSEATETALKIAIQYWQEKGDFRKNKILSRWMSYHGITIGALSMSGHKKRRERYSVLLDDCPKVSPPYCYRCPLSKVYPSCNLMCASELEKAIKREGEENIAAFIAEPIVGAAGGAIMPPPGYYEKIREICDRYNILFIVDEVMTGFGRTGKMFAIDHWGIVPDLMAVGKGMSGGYTPIAATLVSEKVMLPILNGSKVIMSGHTFSANPQSAAVASAVLHYIESNQLVNQSKEKGDYLYQKMVELKRQFQIIGDVRGTGLMIGVEFVSDLINKIPFQKEISITSLVVQKAREKGLLVYPAQAGSDDGNGDAILIAPPLIISEQEIDILVKLLSETLLDIQNDLHERGFINFAG